MTVSSAEDKIVFMFEVSFIVSMLWFFGYQVLGSCGLHDESIGDPVSIQLVSPASGDFLKAAWGFFPEEVSIQLVSPASGDQRTCGLLG